MHYEGHMAHTLEPAATKDTSFDIERERLALERMKLEIERDKLAAGRQKIKWIALAVVISLLIVAGTLWMWLFQQYLQIRDDDALKAAEIIRSAKIDEPGMASLDDKKELLRLLAAHPGQQAEIVGYWKALFPNDDWVVPLQRTIQEGARTKQSSVSATKSKPTPVASEPAPRSRQDAPLTAKDFGGEALGIEIPQSDGQSGGGTSEGPVFR
jgi:hypothetical protein